MTPCAPEAHRIRVVEIEGGMLICECERCLTMVPIASNVCYRCGKTADDHRWFLSDTPICPS